MQLNFNATAVQPASADFEPIPAGWYQFIIEKAEFLPLSKGNGSRISFQAKVQGPTHANRVVFGNINYQHNDSPQAQEIGQRQLSALCHAIGVMNLQNVGQLCGIPFEGRIKITAPTYNVKGDVNSGILYEAKNEFQGFRAVQTATASAPQQAPQQPAQQALQQPAPQQQAPAQQPVEQQQQQQPANPANSAAGVQQPW